MPEMLVKLPAFEYTQGVLVENSPAIAGIGSEDKKQRQGKRCDIKNSRYSFVVSQVWEPVTSWLQGKLSLADQVMLLHNGNITVASRANTGESLDESQRDDAHVERLLT